MKEIIEKSFRIIVNKGDNTHFTGFQELNNNIVANKNTECINSVPR